MNTPNILVKILKKAGIILLPLTLSISLTPMAFAENYDVNKRNNSSGFYDLLETPQLNTKQTQLAEQLYNRVIALQPHVLLEFDHNFHKELEESIRANEIRPEEINVAHCLLETSQPDTYKHYLNFMVKIYVQETPENQVQDNISMLDNPFFDKLSMLINNKSFDKDPEVFKKYLEQNNMQSKFQNFISQEKYSFVRDYLIVNIDEDGLNPTMPSSLESFEAIKYRFCAETAYPDAP